MYEKLMKRIDNYLTIRAHNIRLEEIESIISELQDYGYDFKKPTTTKTNSMLIGVNGDLKINLDYGKISPNNTNGLTHPTNGLEIILQNTEENIEPQKSFFQFPGLNNVCEFLETSEQDLELKKRKEYLSKISNYLIENGYSQKINSSNLDLIDYSFYNGDSKISLELGNSIPFIPQDNVHYDSCPKDCEGFRFKFYKSKSQKSTYNKKINISKQEIETIVKNNLIRYSQNVSGLDATDKANFILESIGFYASESYAINSSQVDSIIPILEQKHKNIHIISVDEFNKKNLSFPNELFDFSMYEN